MYRKLLIANRGEIACRIMRTCRRLGIATVAVHSDADAVARHVREADQALRIGAAPARQSYLDAGAVVAAAVAAGADAIHPGYGFLSEKTALIDACAARGIAFVGPHREAIVRMGSKTESKRIARGAGVPCVPGYDGDDLSDERLAAEARRIGFPLLIKASAGGGGKGMRRVDHADSLAPALAEARGEARAAFGDDRVLLERLLRRPRHLEVQLWGDRHGGLVHLFERECSIQRHYQKVIEEAPAGHLSPVARERLYAAALALGRGIGYDSVGTVEFVMEAGSEEPWFLEMNTRLQVEHPVTELTTGLDLVECQLRSALGEALPFAQEAIVRHGWAIEARINAETPERDFAPSPGVILDYAEPAVEGVRVDSGVGAGSEVTLHYDSMIAKLIAHAGTRAVAAERLRRALADFVVVGVGTNQRLLREIVADPGFDLELHTGFLAERFPLGHAPAPQQALELRAAAAAAAYFALAPVAGDRPLDSLRGFRLGTPAGLPARKRFHVEAGPQRTEVLLEVIATDRVRCHAAADEGSAGKEGNEDTEGVHVWDYTEHADGVVGERGRHRCRRDADGSVHAWIEGEYRHWRVRTALEREAEPGAEIAAGDMVCATMPGVISELLVATGDEVVAGQKLATLEAMKLFHALAAPRAGRIAHVAARVGDKVAQHAVILALEPASRNVHAQEVVEVGGHRIRAAPLR